MKKCKRASGGFTLAELLIVVAIIAVLVSIAIPVFTRELEKSREAVDLANVRSAYTALMSCVYDASELGRYNGQVLRQQDGTFRVVVKPLKQKQDGWSMRVEGLSLAGVPSSEWIREPRTDGACSLIFHPDTHKMDLIWGTFYPYTPLQELHEIPNEKRVKEDQRTLQALGDAILAKGWSKAELLQNLGILEKGGIRIADYYQQKTGSFATGYASAGFRITSKDTGELGKLLSSIGYDSGASESHAIQKPSSEYIDGLIDTVNTNHLFFSDQLGANQYKNYSIDQTKRSIIIDNIHEQNGRITSFRIYTKAMDNQANLNDADKKLFEFTLSR